LREGRLAVSQHRLGVGRGEGRGSAVRLHECAKAIIESPEAQETAQPRHRVVASKVKLPPVLLQTLGQTLEEHSRRHRHHRAITPHSMRQEGHKTDPFAVGKDASSVCVCVC
jgi:hypothetical protein